MQNLSTDYLADFEPLGDLLALFMFLPPALKPDAVVTLCTKSHK
jgi:hypothetical protein